MATNLIKMVFVLSDGSGRLGGIPEEHRAKLHEYAEALKPYLEDDNNDLFRDIQPTIENLDKQNR